MQNIFPLMLALFLSLICGFLFIPTILDFCKKRQLYDFPNQRKMHHTLVPRLGGIAFLPSMLFAFFIAINAMGIDQQNQKISINVWSMGFMVSLLLIYGIGIIDDITGLGAKTKFTVQAISASILPMCGLYINNLFGFLGIYEIPYYIGFPLTVIVIVFIDNAINLIDGIDGLAASLSILSLLGFLYGFMTEGLLVYSVLISGLIGILISYLYFNIWGKEEKNRKIFMGDSGSLTLGFILGFLFVKFSMDNPEVMLFSNERIVYAYTLLIVPNFDVVRLIFVRLSHHKSPFQADKNHIHHKLMKIGLTQHQSLVAILGIAIMYIILNFSIYKWVGITWLVVIDALIFIGIQTTITHIIHERGIKTGIHE